MRSWEPMRRLGIVGIGALSLLGCAIGTDLDGRSRGAARAADTASAAVDVSEPKLSAACEAQSANSLDGLPDQLDCTGLYADIRTKKLAASAQVQSCYVRQWFRFAYGRGETEQDTCVLASLGARFTEAGADVNELLVAFTSTDIFLYRIGGNL